MGPAVLLMLAMACGGNRRGPVQPPPAWQSSEGRVEAKIDMADALVRGGSPDAALAMVTQIRNDGVKDERLDLVQARALRDIGLTDDAEGLLRDLVRRHPRLAEAHNQLGILCMETQRLDEALALLERASRLAPDDALVLNNLGFALLAEGDSTQATEILRQALRLDATDRQIRNNLGFALVASGKDAEALRVFRAGLPEPDARYNLGLGFELRGDDNEAVDQYARVLLDWPTHQPALEGLRRLRAGELHRITPPSSQTEVP